MTPRSERTQEETQQRQTPEKDNNGPDIELRDGPLRSASWRNEGEHGAFYNTRMSRSYVNKEGQYQETTTMRERDLLPLAKLAEDTYRQIIIHKRDHAYDHGREPQNKQQPNMRENAQERFEGEEAREVTRRENFKTERSSKGTRRSQFRERKAR